MAPTDKEEEKKSAARAELDGADMAKVGEGDERWIVKEREDGKNCNGWHWSETNLTEWSKERLTELLVGIVAMDEG